MLLLLVAGCDRPSVSAAHDAEARLQMIKANGGSADEICKASQAVADAWLHALDQDRYRLAKLEAATACNEAELARLR